MGWLIAFLLVLIYAGHWFIACVLAGMYLYSRFRAKPLAEKSSSETGASPLSASQLSPGSLSTQDLSDLLLLRLELGRLLAAGAIDRVFYEQTIEHIDTLSTEVLARWDLIPQNEQWRQRREAAWELLAQQRLLPPGPPPWHSEEQVDISPFTTPEQPRTTVTLPPLPTESAALLTQAPLVPPSTALAASTGQPPQPQATLASAFQTASPAPVEPRLHAPPPVSTETKDYGWQPAGPTVLERALQTVSGWPALLAPFLVQNIGWFIGGLCFVAGSILLVSYTTGFAKALAVAAVLLAYTVGILWAGYQLRRRRPELETSSSVLLTLGALLAPLNVAASVRLLVTGQDALGFALGLLTTVAVLGGLYFATMLVSGVMDRSLQGRHPQIFLSLAAVQLAVPLLIHFPSWLLLAALHLLLLGLLAYGLLLFTRDWLHSIFVERRKIAYYAAGTLVYAAVVSFIHLTWGYQHPLTLPGGYYSPFLMALCGLLFSVDARLKHWANQYVFLSRFSFVLYGLSLLALLLSLHAPAARLITLLLAIGLYGMVVWQYRTLTPLYLLLGCVSWLYGLLVLQPLPNQWYLFASLPGLAGLFAASRWLQRQQFTPLALVCYRVWMSVAFALTGWSLLHAEPGVVAMSTAAAMMGLAFYGLQWAPAQLFGDLTETEVTIDLHHGPWLYSVTFMGSVAIAYAPQWTGLGWTTQCAFGLVLLASLWTACSLRLHRGALKTTAAQRAVLLNSALLNLGVCLLLTVILAEPGLTHNRALPLLLAAMGSVLLWLSLDLRVQWLFYGVLGMWGAAGAILKLTYFPLPGTGAVEMLLALTVWTVLWWLERESDEVRMLRQEQVALRAAQVPPLTLLWRFPVAGTQTHEAMLRLPLQQAMVLLWTIGMGHLGARFLEGNLGWSWVLSAGFAALGVMLAAGRFRLPALLPLAMLLGLAAWLTTAFKLGIATVAGLSLAGTLYALLVWRLCVSALGHPGIARFAKILHLGGSRIVTETCVHWTAFAMTLLGIVHSLAQDGLFTPSAALLLTLVTSVGFLWLAGQRYQQQLHSYVLLGVAVLGVLLSYAWVSLWYFSQPLATLHSLLIDPGLGLLAALLSLSFWAIAQGLIHWAGEADQADFVRSLYRKPLRVVAVLLALFAAHQQLSLTWNTAAHAASPLSICVLFLASVSLLLANHALRYSALSLLGILLVVLTVLWAEAAWFHPATAFTLWPDSRTFTDQWLTLASLTVGLSYLTQSLSRSARWEHLYTQPLRIAAVVTYGWALLGALTLFALVPARMDGWLACVFLTLTLSSFLMLGHSSWIGFPWLAGLTLTCAGLAFNVAWGQIMFPQSSAEHPLLSQHAPIMLVLANLLWGNLLLRIVPLWRQHGQTWSVRWGWRTHDLVTPFVFWPAVLLLTCLASLFLQAVLSLQVFSFGSSPIHWPFQVLIGSVLTISFLHLWWLHRATWEGHAMLFALLCTCLALWLGSATSLFSLPLFLALWSAALLLAHFLWAKHQWGNEARLSLRHTLSTWLDPSLLIAIAALVLIPQVPLGERLITLSVLIVATASLGWQRRQHGWLFVALVMFLVLLHSWPLLWVPFSQTLLLLPWYALQLASLSWLLLWLCDSVTETCRASINQVLPGLEEISRFLSWAWPGVATLALLEWLLHGFFLFTALAATGYPQWLTGGGDAAAALLAAGLLLTLGSYRAWQSRRAAWVYGVLVFGGALGLYIRLLLVGLASASVWDTAVLMGASCIIFVIYRLTLSAPLFHAVMILPLLTLLTVPLQLAAPHTGVTFLTAGALYLLFHHETDRRLPLYLAFLALNAATYLWVPGWVHHYQMFQVYIVPAALSVLLLLHYHRHELKPSVLNSARLATLSILYTSATFDVFVRDELTIFGVALALSLAGIIIGIALRTRAFLYSGTAFLVLNILGQLLMLFPEQMLGRAIILLALGAIITGGMIWFNLQREKLLQRIRIFRADLATWA
jgi:hypothetical protein